MPIPIIRALCMAGASLILVSLLASGPAWAEPFVLGPDNPAISILDRVDILEDPDKSLTIQDVTSPEMLSQFTPNTLQANEFGQDDIDCWFHFSVVNLTPDAHHAYLFLGRFPPPQAELYYRDPGGDWTGVDIATNLEKWRLETLMLPLPPPGNEREYLYKIQGSMLPILMYLELMTDDSFHKTVVVETLATGLYLGAFALIILLGLVLSVSLRSFAVFSFAMFVLSLGGILILDIGLTKLIFPHGSWHLMFLWQTLFFILLFSWSFLGIRSFRHLSRIVPALMAACVILYLLNIFIGDPWIPLHILKIIPLMLMSTVTILPYAAYQRYRQGFRPALIFLWSWPPLFLGILSHIALNEAWIAPYLPIRWGLHMGALLQVLIGCYALACMFRSQREAAREQLLKVEQETASRLEREVADRTRQLARTNEMLQASETNYRNVCERATDGIIIVRDTRVLYANLQMGRMIGLEPSKLTGVVFTEFVVPEQRLELRKLHDMRLATEQTTQKPPAAVRGENPDCRRQHHRGGGQFRPDRIRRRTRHSGHCPQHHGTQALPQGT